MSNGVHIMPISGINAYVQKWTMKARVISKGTRTYKNAKGEGKLLNVEFADAQVRFHVCLSSAMRFPCCLSPFTNMSVS